VTLICTAPRAGESHRDVAQGLPNTYHVKFRSLTLLIPCSLTELFVTQTNVQVT